MPSSVTRSPSRSPRTAAPTSATSPAISWPGQTVGTIIVSWYQCRSVPQMPQLRTATTTSSGPGVGPATSSSTTVPGPRQNAARILAVISPPRVMSLDRLACLRREGVTVLESQARRGNGPLDDELDLPGDHRQPAAARHEPSRATAGHRDDRQTEPDGEHEGALLELAEAAVTAAPPLGEDDERLPPGAHAVERGDGIGRALTIDGHHAQRVEHRAHHRVPPQALLRGEAGRTRQVAEQCEDVEVALVVRREHERAPRGHVLEPGHLHAHAEHALERAGARLGETPRQPLVAR